jgi:hypothetical protein
MPDRSNISIGAPPAQLSARWVDVPSGCKFLGAAGVIPFIALCPPIAAAIPLMPIEVRVLYGDEEDACLTCLYENGKANLPCCPLCRSSQTHLSCRPATVYRSHPSLAGCIGVWQWLSMGVSAHVRSPLIVCLWLSAIISHAIIQCERYIPSSVELCRCQGGNSAPRLPLNATFGASHHP